MSKTGEQTDLIAPQGDAKTTKLMMNKSQRRRIWKMLTRDLFFFALVAILAFLALLLAWPFLSPILLALATVVIVKPLYDWFLKRRLLRGNTRWAAIITIVATFLLVAIPVILFFSAAFSQAQDLISGLVGVDGGNSIQSLLGSIERGINQVPGGGNVQIAQQQATSEIQSLLNTVGGWLGDVALSLGAALPGMFMGAIIAMAVVMVLLPRYEHPNEGELKTLIPFPEQITDLYLQKSRDMITGMFRGTFVIAFVQGLAMGFVYWVAGVPSVLFFTLLSMIAALLPVVGLAIVAWPIGLILILNGQVWQGIWVFAAHILVVQNLDVVLRPRLVPKGAYLNPALLLLGVFGGINLLGPIGALYGPVIMVLLVTSISVYSKYMLRTNLEPFLDANGKLDMKKLGLESSDDETKKSGWFEKAANNVIGHLLKRSGSSDDTDDDSPAASPANSSAGQSSDSDSDAPDDASDKGGDTHSDSRGHV